MKYKKYIIILTLTFLASFVQAGENVEVETVEAVETTEFELDHKDRFLSLIYTKAESYIGKGEMALGEAVNTTMEEVPLIVEEFILWRIISHLWEGLTWIISFSVILFLLFRIYKNSFDEDGKEKYNYWSNGPDPTLIFFFTALLFVLLLITFSGIFIGLNTSALEDIKLAFKAWFTPRIYIIDALIEYAQKLK